MSFPSLDLLKQRLHRMLWFGTLHVAWSWTWGALQVLWYRYLQVLLSFIFILLSSNARSKDFCIYHSTVYHYFWTRNCAQIQMIYDLDVGRIWTLLSTVFTETILHTSSNESLTRCILLTFTFRNSIFISGLCLRDTLSTRLCCSDPKRLWEGKNNGCILSSMNYERYYDAVN